MNEVRHWSVRGIFTVAAIAGALLLFAASPAHAGGGCHQPVTSDTGAVVHLEGICFTPTVVHVEAGDTVTWVNDLSKAAHTVTGANGAFGSLDELAPGASFAHEFSAEGTYPYYCFLHPGMAGAVVVGDGTASSTSAESVSVASGAQPNQTIDPSSASSGGGIGNVWLFVLLSGAAAMATATGGFALGTRRARR